MKVDFRKAAATVLRESVYRNWFIVFSILIYAAYILIPVFLTPGNYISFQLSLLRPVDFVLFLVMSLVTALLIVMQLYVHNRSKKKRMLAAVGEGGVSVYSAMFGGMLATAACSSCIAGLVGFLGAGSTFFILENQMLFVAGALFIVFVSLFFTARRVNEYCLSCEVKPDSYEE